MSNSPPIRKLIASLIIITLAIGVVALVVGSQMVQTQTKVRDLQSQLATYENTTNSLQSQASSLEAQIKYLQNPIDNVTLTVVSKGNWYADPVAGYPWYKFINITLQNFGTETIGGMTLDFRVEGNTTNISYYIHANTNQGVLHVNETRSLRIQLITSIDQKRELADCTLTITLLLDQKVLDRKTVTIGN